MSQKAFRRLVELGFPCISSKNERKEDFGKEDLKIVHYEDGDSYCFLENSFETETIRKDPLIVKVVEELGVESFGSGARLETVEVPDDIDLHIDEDDGIEKIIDWNTGEQIIGKNKKGWKKTISL